MSNTTSHSKLARDLKSARIRWRVLPDTLGQKHIFAQRDASQEDPRDVFKAARVSFFQNGKDMPHAF